MLASTLACKLLKASCTATGCVVTTVSPPSVATSRTCLKRPFGYAAILEPARLRDGLGALATLLDARAAGVRVETVGVGVRQEWVGLEPSFDRAYVDHYWRDDPWAASIWHQPVGAVGHGDALAPRAVLEASAFHNELARPRGASTPRPTSLRRLSRHI